MQRFLALDLGEQRTGIALVDDFAKTATPLDNISSKIESAEFYSRLIEFIEEWEPVALIVGLPIDLKGKESIAAKSVRETSVRIKNHILEKTTIDLDLIFIDERLTTKQAERSMLEHDIDRKKRKNLRDSLAAMIIAQTFIDTI